jgi:hypothetical protein
LAGVSPSEAAREYARQQGLELTDQRVRDILEPDEAIETFAERYRGLVATARNEQQRQRAVSPAQQFIEARVAAEEIRNLSAEQLAERARQQTAAAGAQPETGLGTREQAYTRDYQQFINDMQGAYAAGYRMVHPGEPVKYYTSNEVTADAALPPETGSPLYGNDTADSASKRAKALEEGTEGVAQGRAVQQAGAGPERIVPLPTSMSITKSAQDLGARMTPEQRSEYEREWNAMFEAEQSGNNVESKMHLANLWSIQMDALRGGGDIPGLGGEIPGIPQVVGGRGIPERAPVIRRPLVGAR